MVWLTAHITRALKRGYQRLQSPAAAAVRTFLTDSCDAESGLFMDRGGHGDLYYTAFGLACASATGSHLPGLFRLEETLAAMALPPDLVHWRARQICHQAGRLLRGEWLRLWLPWPECGRLAAFLADAPASAFPHADRNSPYAQFLLQTLYQDNRWGRASLDGLEGYACADLAGGWSNSVGGSPSLNAAMAVVLLRKMRGEALPEGTLGWLCGQQEADGGFPAHPGAPCADLLSTALALFTLQECDVTPCYSARGFIARHCLPGGSFTATDWEGDDLSDPEYTFYGLLAIGSCDA